MPLKSAESNIDKCTSGKDEDEPSNTKSEKTDVSKMDLIPTEKNTAEKKSGTINLMDVNKSKITDEPAIEERQETSTDINKSETLQTKAQEKRRWQVHLEEKEAKNEMIHLTQHLHGSQQDLDPQNTRKTKRPLEVVRELFCNTWMLCLALLRLVKQYCRFS